MPEEIKEKEPKIRKFIILVGDNTVNISPESEHASPWEMVAICQAVINSFSLKPQ